MSMYVYRRLNSALFFLLTIVSCSISSNVMADASGRAGYSGLTPSKVCTSCHSGTAAAPTVTVAGPTAVAAGSINSYTVTVRGGPAVAAGIDVAATAGTLATSGAGAKLLSREIVHSAPKTMNGGAASFTFSWQAPTTNGPATLFATGVSTNGNNTDTGDGAGATSLAITVGGGPAAGLAAVIHGPTTGVVGAAVAFDGSGSTVAGGTISQYDWNFGDGTAGSGVKVNHTFTAGTYNVRLTITSNTGATNSATLSIRVTTVAGAPGPVANAGGPYSGTLGTAVNFDGSASTVAGGSLIAYNWNFGDSQTSAGAKVAHTYATSGNFTVTLEVVANNGVTAHTQTRADIVAAGGAGSPSIGQTLYDVNCASCHGLNGTGGSAVSVVGASASGITSAIASVATMRTLSTLSAADITEIATYLSAGGAAGSGTDDEDNTVSADSVSSGSRDDAQVQSSSNAKGAPANPFVGARTNSGGLDGLSLLFVTAWGVIRRLKAK